MVLPLAIRQTAQIDLPQIVAVCGKQDLISFNIQDKPALHIR
jgi:hypothetical protein